MKISSIRSFLMSYPLPEPLKMPFFGGLRTILKRDAMLIRVETDGGLIGYAPGQASERAQNAIRTQIAPFLEGKNLAEPDALRILFLRQAGDDAYLRKIYATVEIALYDLLGKALGAPVSELIGGRVRDRIRVYGSAGMYMAPEKYAEEAAAIAALGFHAYKMRPALGPALDLDTVRLVREALPADFDLMVDAHAWWRMGDRSYSPQAIEEIAEGMAEHGITWLEEPLPPDDHEGYRALKDKAIVPLASGEHEPGDERYLDLIQNQCVDYVQMDVCCQGGYHSGRLIVTEVEREGLRFAFHSWGTALEVIAAAHLGICWPETVAEWLEYPCYSAPGRIGMYAFPLAEEILTEPLEIVDGDLEVPRTPGLGITVDEAVIERYPWIPGPWSWFRLDSPAETWYITSDHSVKWEGGLELGA